MNFDEVEENSIFIFQPSSNDVGKRLDQFLAENVEDWSRSRLQNLIDNGDVLVNSKETKSSYKLRADDEIEVELAETSAEKFAPENIPLEIIYEDESLAVINKLAGMIVHPGAGAKSGTLANALAYKFQIPDSELQINANLDEQSKIENLKSKIGIVHRLDKNTSGLIVVAKDETTHEALAKQFHDREIYKSYVALVHGSVRGNSGKIDEKIGRDRYNRTKMAISKNGRSALSLWKVRRRYEKFTLLEIEIKTGRTHQIRVHLAFLNHPIVGDETYNEGRDNTIADVQLKKAVGNSDRFFLHAEKLSFTHPKTAKRMDFYAPLPKDLQKLLEII